MVFSHCRIFVPSPPPGTRTPKPNTHSHPHSHTPTLTCSHTPTQTQTCTYIRTQIHMLSHTNSHSHAFTNTHTFTHTTTHSPLWGWLLPFSERSCLNTFTPEAPPSTPTAPAPCYLTTDHSRQGLCPLSQRLSDSEKPQAGPGLASGLESQCLFLLPHLHCKPPSFAGQGPSQSLSQLQSQP